MGQRELILMILASVITALAIFAGIKIFQNQEVNFEEDEYTQLMLEIAEEAQAWYVKPAGIGGGSQSYKNLNWNNISCPLATSTGFACYDDKRKHQIILVGIEAHHFRIQSMLKIGAHMFVGAMDVKADTAIIPSSWHRLK